MKGKCVWSAFSLVLLGISIFLPTRGVVAQSIISGEITGTVTDATHAVVADATVTLKSADTAYSQTVATSSSGTFRFPLLKPGSYNLSVTAKGFREAKTTVDAAVGAVNDVPIQLEVGATTETVEVVATAPILQTENANLTTVYTPSQIENIPSPGQDLTNFALSTPGVVLSTGSGYGNFTAFGMPGESNLFTINGGDMNDPYNNLNNSGSSNNMLGQNEIQEVAIVHNGYTGQYGRAASVNMNFTTKSGSNQFHGNAKWDWNGRYLNANDWFNNATGTPRTFANSNQWGGSFGGPILKNKLYFFYDNEGLRYVLPAGGPVYVPTAGWATDVQAHINATESAEGALYQKMFTLYAAAPGSSAATPFPVGAVGSTDYGSDGGCGAADGTHINGTLYGAVFPVDANGVPTGPITASGAPCTKQYQTGVINLNKERLQSIRVDYDLSDKDHMNWRYSQDRGTQPTYTDPISSAFNDQSIQPQDNGQFTEVHTFNPNLVNQLIVGALYYSAIFGPQDFNAAIAAFPTTIGRRGGTPGVNGCGTFDGSLSCMGGETYRYPQGRNVTQYQLVDDMSWTRGNHGFKFGVNFRRVDFADHSPSANHSGDVVINSMNDFVNGVLSSAGTSQLREVFSGAADYQISNYSLGFYAQDEWRVKSNLKLTMSLRLDRNSPEKCKVSCFSAFNGGFSGISHSIGTPYNQSILTGQSIIFPSMEKIVWEPRGGFAWSPDSKTVVRGGVGIFSDLYPAELSTDVLANPPAVTKWTITGKAGNDNIPLMPGVTGGAFALAAADNAAVQAGITSGGTFCSIAAASGQPCDPVTGATRFPGFTFYTVPQHMVNARYTEWNLEVERSITPKLVASVNYVGSHGTNLLVQNNGLNAYTTTATGFDNLPIGAAPDPRFTAVVGLTNNGVSYYNGLVASISTKSIKGFTGTLSYTFSHSLDDLSNGGLDLYSFNQLGDSLNFQVDPQNLRRINYGNSDYDFRHVLNLNYVWEIPYLRSNRWLGGWTIAGTLIKRSGQPYSVATTAPSAIKNYNPPTGTALMLADYTGAALPSCHTTSDLVGDPCIPNDSSAFVTTRKNFGNITRNQFRGPGYFDTDLSIKKTFSPFKSENMPKLVLGANAYNVLNHPNFANPDNYRRSSTFGQLTSTVTPASSPYGNFQGSAVSGRLLQLELGLKF